VSVTTQLWENEFDHFVYSLEERENEPISGGVIKLKLAPNGYSWLRLTMD
jgi:hypothetical protein